MPLGWVRGRQAGTDGSVRGSNSSGQPCQAAQPWGPARRMRSSHAAGQSPAAAGAPRPLRRAVKFLRSDDRARWFAQGSALSQARAPLSRPRPDRVCARARPSPAARPFRPSPPGPPKPAPRAGGRNAGASAISERASPPARQPWQTGWRVDGSTARRGRKARVACAAALSCALPPPPPSPERSPMPSYPSTGRCQTAKSATRRAPSNCCSVALGGGQAMGIADQFR